MRKETNSKVYGEVTKVVKYDIRKNDEGKQVGHYRVYLEPLSIDGFKYFIEGNKELGYDIFERVYLEYTNRKFYGFHSMSLPQAKAKLLELYKKYISSF